MCGHFAVLCTGLLLCGSKLRSARVKSGLVCPILETLGRLLHAGLKENSPATTEVATITSMQQLASRWSGSKVQGM